MRPIAKTEVDLEPETRQAASRAGVEGKAGDIPVVLDTVPLRNAVVQELLAQASASAGAPAPVTLPTPAEPSVQPRPARRAASPPRRLGVEIAIGVFAFLIVAVPALYYLYRRLR